MQVWALYCLAMSYKQPQPTPAFSVVAGCCIQVWALYCLAMMYHKMHAELAPIRPLSKFLVVKV